MDNDKKVAVTGAQRSPAQHVMRGSFWIIALRWTVRLIGLVSTVILARLLVPADFGIVSMAMFVVGLLELLNLSGQKLVLIRHHAPGRPEYDTAWTISVLAACLIGCLILAAAPLAVMYFHEPRVEPVLQCLALRSILSGFENIGITDYRRDLKFHIFFWYSLVLKVVSFVVTIALAILIRNYWALVAGIISSGVASIIISYTIHPYRPRFSLAKLDEFRSFSTWTLVKSVGQYFNGQADQIAVGGLFGSSAMGRYSVASDVASSPTVEITEPIVAALYPVMSRTRSDVDALRKLYLRTFGWAATICFSAAVGTTLVAHDLVHLLLGAKWLDAEPIMGWLALAAGLLGLSAGAYTAFDAIGKPQLGARMQWTRVVILAVVLVPVSLILRSVMAIAIARFAVTALFIPTLLFAVGHEIKISALDYAKVMWRPAAASGMMSLLILTANGWLAPGNLRFACDVLLGAFSFTLSLLFFWRASGMPVSPESDIWAILVDAYGKLKSRSFRAASV